MTIAPEIDITNVSDETAAGPPDGTENVTLITPEPRALRDYQVEAVAAVEAEWDTGLQRTSVILPTGSGKSTVIAKLADMHRDKGVVMLAHRAELINQMSEAVAAVNPSAPPVGKVIANHDEPDAEIVAASFQTLSTSPDRLRALGRRGVILVDECHHALAASYVKVLTDLGLNIDTTDLTVARESDVVRTGTRPEVVACGFTATMSRADSLRLGKVWNSVAFERDLVWGLENGHLITPVGKTIRVEALDKLASIKTVAGDYNKGELQEVMSASVDTTVSGIIEHARGRNILVFASSVAHARSLAAALTRAGIRAASVTGNDKEDRREAVYGAFHDGGLDAMVTVQVLTEGADFPRCDAVVLARPTRSKVLLTQIIGRCVRPYTYEDGSKKKDALVLDLTGVVRDSKMVSLAELWGEASTTEYTEDGEVYVPPPPPAPKKPKAKRQGRAEVEEIDLLDKSSRFRDMLWITSPSGVVFLPSGKGREAYIVWPPYPARAEHTNLLMMDEGGRVSTYLDTQGVPVRAPFTDTVNAALNFALERKAFVNVRAPWRGAGRRPTSKQTSLAERIGVPVEPSDSAASVSDKITAMFTDAALSRAGMPATAL